MIPSLDIFQCFKVLLLFFCSVGLLPKRTILVAHRGMPELRAWPERHPVGVLGRRHEAGAVVQELALVASDATTSRIIAQIHGMIRGNPSVCQKYKPKRCCNFGEVCSSLQKGGGRTVEENKDVWRKKWDSDPYSDAEPPETNSIPRKDTISLRPRRRVRLTSKVLQSEKKRERNHHSE